jgi:two-component sensor histidine kinase
VALRRQREELVLEVADDGVGQGAPTKSGLGGRLITAFVEQLMGAATVRREAGYAVSIRFPVSDARP